MFMNFGTIHILLMY